MCCPIRPQEIDHLCVVNPNRGLQDLEQLRRETGPGLAKDQVVCVLDVEASDAASDVEGGEQFLNVKQAHVPGMLLIGECIFEGVGRAAMASAGVVENDGQLSLRDGAFSGQSFGTPWGEEFLSRTR